MISDNQIDHVVGSTAYDTQGNKIGTVGRVYFDDQTGAADWVTVDTGLFGTSESFVPVHDADLSGDRLVVRYSKDQIKDAPHIDDDGHLSPEEERALYAHYTVHWDAAATSHTETSSAGDDSSGRASDDAMTRSEEKVEIGTTSQQAGRARLRKYVVTEQVTQTVPVTRERAVLETEPITDANIGAALDGPAIAEAEHEVVLHEEKPVVQKTVEPVERVRLRTEQTTEQQTVTEEVRKERIEAEGDITRSDT